ncbi:uncharacterized protein CDV56_103467 [Aspergillus thermomutatus]|uniref:Uncharacterized protein n=1 Tax=Aspergillus thermomutatus TaxID=41047 RepID=A0A397GBF2_ASPTH|nr:uncharacterized protein CDV56_103467 [Aspergillus thermomutatus]RHZ47797.1 hypothetical protein CDV56_103467 [Aspergillus thermomutatus]
MGSRKARKLRGLPEPDEDILERYKLHNMVDEDTTTWTAPLRKLGNANLHFEEDVDTFPWGKPAIALQRTLPKAAGDTNNTSPNHDKLFSSGLSSTFPSALRATCPPNELSTFTFEQARVLSPMGTRMVTRASDMVFRSSADQEPNFGISKSSFSSLRWKGKERAAINRSPTTSDILFARRDWVAERHAIWDADGILAGYVWNKPTTGTWKYVLKRARFKLLDDEPFRLAGLDTVKIFYHHNYDMVSLDKGVHRPDTFLVWQ